MFTEAIRHDLPTVEDGNPRVVTDLAYWLEGFIDGDMPGVGIAHTSRHSPGHRGIHHWHRNLVSLALNELGESIYDEPFGPIHPARGRYGVTAAHTDDWAVREESDEETEEFGDEDVDAKALVMNIRLHTASPVEGAEVIVTNTGAGYYTRPGDRDGFDGDDLPIENFTASRGYDGQALENGGDYIGHIDLATGLHDGIMHDSTIYNFSQYPNCSVLFRSRATLGPVSIHGFASFHTGASREIIFSDLKLLAH